MRMPGFEGMCACVVVGACFRLCSERRWVELDEHTGILVIWTQRPPKGLVYKIEVRWEECKQGSRASMIVVMLAARFHKVLDTMPHGDDWYVRTTTVYNNTESMCSHSRRTN